MLNKIFYKAIGHILHSPFFIKYIITFLVDIFLCFLTVGIAFYLRLGNFLFFNTDFLLASVISIVLAIPIFLKTGLYRNIFRYSGASSMLSVFFANFVYSIFYLIIITVLSVNNIPRTIGIIQPFLLFFAVSGSRALIYYLHQIVDKNNRTSSNFVNNALIYGAGNAGRQLASALKESFKIKVVGFLDDNSKLHNQILNGYNIFSPDDLKKLIKSKKVTHVLLALPSVILKRRIEIIQKLSKNNVIIRTLPSFNDLAEGRITISAIRSLDIDELLGRDQIDPNYKLLNKNISNKVVLVTGSGGSIGSELCRQIVKLNPKKLLLVEISEHSLYNIHSELEEIKIKKNYKINIVPLLASVQDKKRMLDIMDIWKPHTIYHAAAYKHVPLVEYNIIEGIKNNIFGTLITAEAAIEKKVSNFVLISSDKAVRPTSVMGASKRVAELCLQALFIDSSKLSKIKLSIVRFGNVLDSSGSIIPKFKKQILEGGPVTLTHPKVTRYFMTIPEAAQLVIQASAITKGCEVFILDMNEPLKINDLIKKMISLSGLSIKDKNNPDGDIEIKIIGLRPGEKLHEELLLGEKLRATSHPKILKAHDPYIPWSQLNKNFSVLKILLDQNKIEPILDILKKLVTGYQSPHKIFDLAFIERKKFKNSKIKLRVSKKYFNQNKKINK
jgi:FlaA1/EpsC-like NDP-sugar epimerase